jgi:dipeptidyl aminopeptidase/acylaminoacyl peptidase
MLSDEQRVELRNRRGQRLIADVLVPVGPSPHPAVLVIHGLGGHRNERHIVVVAQRLVARGVVSMRVDLANNVGESDGSFRDLTLSGEVDDAEDALGFLREMDGIDAERIGAAGHSFGGLVVPLLAARRRTDVRSLALMSSVFDAPSRFRENFADREREWRERGAIDIGGGNELGIGFFDDLSRWDVRAEAARVTAPALIIHGEDDTEVPMSEGREAARHLRSRTELRTVPGGDHTYSDDRALGAVADAVDGWFAQTLRAAEQHRS